MRTFVISVLVALVGAAAFGSALAKPQAREDEDKFVLQNDLVTVWFQGKKPMLKVFPTALADANATGAYEYRFTDVVEYRDLDGNGAPTSAEIVSQLDLNAASGWNVEQTEADGAVVLNLTLEAPVKLGASLPENVTLPTERAASIGLVFTIRDEAVVLNASGVNVSVPRTSVKYDFVVNEWPFVEPENRLALEVVVTGEIEMEEGQGVDSASLTTNGTELGALTWTTTAQGVLTNGSAVEVPVVTSIAAEDENESRIIYTYDAADLASLVHDPTVGIAGEQESATDAEQGGLNGVPGPGLALVAVALGAAVLVARRR